MTLVYTFRTFPWVEKMSQAFVFSAIKKDLNHFETLIKELNPAQIIGIARSESKYSTQEAFATNQFNQGQINREGLDRYELDILPNLDFKVRRIPTNSFCNYAAYKIEELIVGQDIKHTLVHVTKDDLVPFLEY